MKRLFLLAVLFAMSAALEGAQSVTVTSTCPSACPTVSLPSSAPWTTLGTSSYHWQTRITNISSSITPTNLGPFILYYNTSQLLLTYAVNPPVADMLNSPTPGTMPCCSGRTDVLIMLQRDNAAQAWTLTMCDTQGGNCTTVTYTIATPGSASIATQQVLLGGGYNMAWLRLFSGAVPVTDTIRNSGVTGDLADWEFESSLVDSVGGLTFCTGSCSSTVSYSTTPTYNPSCVAGVQQTFKTGVTGTVDGSNSQALDGGTTLTNTWSYAGTGADGVTQSLTFGTATSLITTVSGYVFGSVNLNLALADGSGNMSSCSIHDGAVTVDSHDIVVTGLPGEDLILGPMLRYGSTNNRDPWYDDRNKKLADFQGALLSTNFPDYWDTPETGTVAFSPSKTCGGSAMGFGLVGTGTTFTSYTAGDYIVLYWNGTTNRRLNIISSIFSNTCIIMTFPWDGGTTEMGQSFAHPSSTAVNNWGFATASTPGNYYDNVKAYKAFYRRSGIDTYWTYYTTLADNFWAMPANDKGASYISANQSEFEFQVRSMSLEGMMLRAQDSGMSGMWSGIRNAVNLIIARLSFFISGGTAGYDQREEGAYPMLFMAYDALLDPDGTQVGLSKAGISSMFPPFTAGLSSDSSFPTGAFSRVNQTATVAVTQGNAVVTCASCTFVSGQNGILDGVTPMAFYNGYPTYPPNNASYRATVYYPTFNNAHQVTLDKPYVETSNAAIGYAIGANDTSSTSYNVIGWNNQPFMEGIQTVGFTKGGVAIAASDPTNSALANTYAGGLSNWLTTYGYDDPAHSGVGGMYYFASGLTCAYPVQTTPCTVGNNASQARTLAAEALRGLQQAYVLSPSSPRLAFMRLIYDQMFCKPGTGCTGTYDGSYITDLDDNGGYLSTNAVSNKWLGFFFGWSAGINAAASSVQSLGESCSGGGKMVMGGKFVCQ